MARTINEAIKQSSLLQALLMAALFFLYNELFVTSVFKSSSGVDVKDDNSNVTLESYGFIPTLDSSGSELQQLKYYMESEEAISIFEKVISPDSYRYNSLDFLRNKKLHSSSSSEFYLNINNFYVDELSGVLVIESVSPDKDLSKKANLALLMVANAYFDRQQRINSIIDKYKKMCELVVTENTNLIEFEALSTEPSMQIDLLDSESATEMFSEQTKRSLEKCEQIAQNVMQNQQESRNITIDRVNSDNVQSLIQGIYFDTVASVTQSNNLLVVSEPILARSPEPKRSFFLSILIFIISYLVIISFKIIRSLKSDFNF